MGNCISKINKDIFLSLKKYFKNKRRGLDIILGGGYTRIYSMGKYSKTLDQIQAGRGGETFLKLVKVYK